MFAKKSLFALFFCMSTASFADTTRWLSAVFNGNGCPAGSTVAIAFGDQVQWIFSELGVSLDRPGTESKFCVITAAAEVAHGFYIGTLRQVLSYGGVKTTHRSNGAITTRSRFFGYNVKPFHIFFPDGTSFNTPSTSQARENQFVVNRPPFYWCSPRQNLRGLFSSTLAVNGKTRPGGSISINAQDFDVKFSAEIGWKPCS